MDYINTYQYQEIKARCTIRHVLHEVTFGHHINNLFDLKVTEVDVACTEQTF